MIDYVKVNSYFGLLPIESQGEKVWTWLHWATEYVNND